MHYTDQPSRLDARPDQSPGLIWVEGGGIVTEAMVEKAFSRVRADAMPNVLIDLRDVAGYDAHAVTRAQHLLKGAVAGGVRRIAFVADSSAVHTAAQVMASIASVSVRGFHHERTARAWLNRRTA